MREVVLEPLQGHEGVWGRGSGTGVTQQLLTSVTAQRVAICSAPARTARGHGLGQLPGALPVDNPVDGPARQGWAEPRAPKPCLAPTAARGAARSWDPHARGWSRSWAAHL